VAIAVMTGLDRRAARRTKAERAFRLRRDEPVPDGLRRIARGQLDNAIERLAGRSDEDLGTAIHESRKSFKRLRAVVRLARDDLGDDVYQRENTTFRDIGRSLSELRDRQVVADTLDALLEDNRDELPEGDLGPLRGRLVDERERVRPNTGSLAEAVAELERARARTAGWTFEHPDFDAVGPGLRRIYRRGRRAFEVAREDPTIENLHEWRKRMKDLWYAAQILRPASPRRMKALASHAHDVSDLLGEEHDLAVLNAEARQSRAPADEATLTALDGVIDRRRADLRHRALSAGEDLYARKPKKFVARIERRWRKRVESAPQPRYAGSGRSPRYSTQRVLAHG
jgi:CHAD domain-containing protein